MPRVRPLTESAKIAARWQEQDRKFCKQFEQIRKLSGMTQGRIADELELSVPTLKKYIQCPDKMPKEVERRIVLFAERIGAAYDPCLGGRKVKASFSDSILSINVSIDPKTGEVNVVTA